MALDFANAGQLPKAPAQYNVEYLNQLVRVLEVYFSQLDSQMWNHAERYTAKQFVGGDFHGGRFFGDGNYLKEETQRFTSLVSQAPGPVDGVNIVAFEVASLVNSITLVTPGKMKVSIPGLYELTYFIQFNNSSAALNNVVVWLRKNGADIPNTTSRFSVPITGWTKAIFSFRPLLAANDFVELAWHPNIPAITIAGIPPVAAAPGVNPAFPASPSAVVNMSLIQADMPADAVLRLPHRLRNV